MKTLEIKNDTLRKKNECLRKENEQLQLENKRITEKLTKTQEEVQRLKSILNNNSNNSSLPPSKDQKPSCKKSNEYNNREKSEKTKGGQPGHQGKTLEKSAAMELINNGFVRHEVVNIYPQGVAATTKESYISKYEYDISITPVVREYRYHENTEGATVIPCHHRNDVVYGKHIRTLAVAFYIHGVMSNKRIQEMLNALTNDKFGISSGAVYSFIRDFSIKIEPELSLLEEHLKNRSVFCSDATIVTMDGLQHYVRNISCDDTVVYYGMESKKITALQKITTLNEFAGTIVHDHETVMYRFGVQHAECNVHMLRYLTKNTEDTGNDWSKEMKTLLTELNARKKALKAMGQCFTAEQLMEIDEAYHKIIDTGWLQNEKTIPKWAKDDEARLLRRLKKYRANHLLFVCDFSVPFDNNLSERDLRKCKNRQKMSGGFRTFDGLKMFCSILSYVETNKRRGYNTWDAIERIFEKDVA